MTPVRFALVGIGGYAAVYHEALAQLIKSGKARLVAVAEWNQYRFSSQLHALRQSGVRIFKSYDEMLDQTGDSLDFVGLPVGIHLHAPMTIKALKKGVNVICEKPIAATVQEVDQMIQVRDAYRNQVLVGYQEIYSPSIQKIKSMMVEGKLGKLLAIKVKGGWPRPLSYYNRNQWGGRVRMAEHWVLDGIANNAMAHYLNNMLYVASDQPQESARPVNVCAELYRAWDIESYDTVTLRAQLDGGASLMFMASHCSETEFHPEMTLRCEKATLVRQLENGATDVSYHNGKSEQFDDGGLNARHHLFEVAVKRFHGATINYCSLEIARAQTLCINAMHESCPEIVNIPGKAIVKKKVMNPEHPKTGDYTKAITGMDQMIETAYTREKLFSEMDISWSQASTVFELNAYSHFSHGTIFSLD